MPRDRTLRGEPTNRPSSLSDGLVRVLVDVVSVLIGVVSVLKGFDRALIGVVSVLIGIVGG
jgi:hypothetical protein